MFPQYKHKTIEIVPFKFESLMNVPICEGAQILETVCPINPKTGCRASLPQVLQQCVNDPLKSRQISALLVELPKIKAANVSDEQKLDMCVSVFDYGTPAEEDILRESLTPVVEGLLRDAAPKKDDKPAAASVVESSVTSTAE